MSSQQMRGRAASEYAYRLTDTGRALAKILIAMSEWGETYITRTPAPVRLVDKSTGQPLQTAFVTEDGKPFQCMCCVDPLKR